MLIDNYDKANDILGPKTTSEKVLVSSLKTIGFGRAMQLVQINWGLHNESGKYLCKPGSEFVVGPCRAGVVACGCDNPVDCEWCEGCGWLTKKVKKMKDAISIVKRCN
jgi:hypothetical protein